MLSNNQVVKVRKAFEEMYDSKCTVTVQQEYEKENGATGFGPVVILEDEPCKIQFSTVSSASPDDAVAHVVQEIRLFISPDVEISSGSEIVSNSTKYELSGVAAKYDTHQEIMLKLADGWS